MKSYREIADSVFARREQYIIQQRKKKQTITRVTASVSSVALVSLAGIALLRSDAFRDTPPIFHGDNSITTVTNTPTEIGDTTTINNATATTTDGGIVNPTTPTTSVHAPSQTTAPNKTEPSTTTTTTAPTKLLITADEPDTEVLDQEELSKNKRYITKCLQKMMALYEGVDVEYAVIVTIPAMSEDMGDDFWKSSEELVQFCKEYDEVYHAFHEEFVQLNPTFSGGNVNGQDTVWSDTLRANYERWLTFIEERDRLKEQYMAPYVESVLNQRFEVLKDLCSAEPVDVLCVHYYYEYYVELTAEAINALAEQGGYIFRLASGDTWYQELYDA